MSSEDDTSKFEKFKQHLKDNKKVYFAAGGGAVVGASVTTAIIFRRFSGGFPVELSQTAKNTALIVWKSPPTNIALVREACPEPIPVLDKMTGEAYRSFRRAAAATGRNIMDISKDAQGNQERFVRLSDSVFA